MVGFENNSGQMAHFAEAGNWLRTYLQILSPESDPYGAGWNGSGKVPTKDEIYDKLEGALTPASLAASGAITTSAGKVGYATGAGGTVTQSSNKTSAVTLHKACGEITMSGGALAANTAITFTL